jgi:hypothetical protein
MQKLLSSLIEKVEYTEERACSEWSSRNGCLDYVLSECPQHQIAHGDQQQNNTTGAEETG